MLDLFIIVGAKYLVAVPVAGLGLCFWLATPEERRDLALLAAVSLPAAYALARLAGLLYAHPQPFVEWGTEPLIPHEIDNAFPSDHVLLAGTLGAVIALLARRFRAFGGALFCVAALIGLARVAAGLHSWADVAVSLALAAGVAGMAFLLIRRYGAVLR